MTLSILTKKDELSINLDHVWKWMGYSRKGKAKDLLTKEDHGFIEGKHYTIKASSPIGEALGDIIREV